MIRMLKEWYIKSRTYRQTYKELNSLSNHQLKDLGLTRNLVQEIALEAAYGKDSARYV